MKASSQHQSYFSVLISLLLSLERGVPIHGQTTTSCLICNSITYVPVRQLLTTYMGSHVDRYTQDDAHVDVSGNASGFEPVTIVVYVDQSTDVLTVEHNVLIGDTVVIFGSPTILPTAVTVQIGSQSGMFVDTSVAGNSIEPSNLLSTVYFQTGCSQPLFMGDQFGSIFIQGYQDRSSRGDIHPNETCSLSPWFSAVNTIGPITTPSVAPVAPAAAKETISSHTLIYMGIGVGTCICAVIVYVAIQRSREHRQDDASPHSSRPLPPVPLKRKASDASVNSLEWDMAAFPGKGPTRITYSANPAVGGGMRPSLTPDQRMRSPPNEGLRGALPTMHGEQQEVDAEVQYRTEKRRNAYIPSHLFSPQETEDLDIDHELMLHLTGASRRVRHPKSPPTAQHVQYSVPNPARKSKQISPTRTQLPVRIAEVKPKSDTTRTYDSIKSRTADVDEVTYDRVRLDGDSAADDVSECGYSRISELRRAMAAATSPRAGDDESVHYEQPVAREGATPLDTDPDASEGTHSLPSDTPHQSLARSRGSLGTDYLLVPDTVAHGDTPGLQPLPEGEVGAASGNRPLPPLPAQRRRAEPVYTESLKKQHRRSDLETPSYIQQRALSQEDDEPLYCVTEDLMSTLVATHAMLGTKRRSDGADAVVSGRGHEVECAAFEPREPTYAVADKNRKSQMLDPPLEEEQEAAYDLARANK
eukprot:m.657255 g.657255  ORF g.657255 m.657255 type:complete len:700 (+) comp22711_c0_seq2:492-2591(+)